MNTSTYQFYLSLEQLRIFVRIAETLHVTRAAKDLNLTQAAVSAALGKLERNHGVSLFDRVGRGIELNEEGRLFLPSARAVLAAAQVAQDTLQDLAVDTRGRLRIHASQTIAMYWLPHRMMEMRSRFPQVELELRVGNTTDVVQAVRAGDADIGLTEGIADYCGLDSIVVAQDSLALVVDAAHPVARRAALDVSEFYKLRWILREIGSGTRAVFEDYLRRNDVDPGDLTVSMSFPTNEAILAAIEGTESVAVMSRRATKSAILGGRIAVLDLPGAERAFTAVTHAQRTRSRATQAMMKILVSGNACADTETVVARNPNPALDRNWEALPR
ncbi:MAG: LysR family transcriptional regulator [Alphaproteobacteria bacterium]